VPVRLQKFLADAGVASRRAGEKLIVEGRVTVNGQIVRVLGSKVDPDHDQIVVDGQKVKTRKKIYIALHKPADYICTRSDPEERRTVMELLPKEWANVFPVGRLDRDSEGLLFLTNDGDFCLRLTHPRYGVRKTYLAVVEGRMESAMLGRLTAGVRDRGELLKAESVRLIDSNNSHSQVELVMREGKNREIRRLFEVLELPVVRLVRMRIGPIRLGELPVGRWRALTESEIKSLLPPL
jgi:23S rRNA pseudouridine2605 synthase